MHTFTATGQHVPIDARKMLTDHGFRPDQEVVAKKHPDDKHELLVMDDPVVVESSDGQKHSFAMTQFMATWFPYEEQNYSMSEEHLSSTHHGFQTIAAKANIYTAMDATSKSIGKPSVRMQAKPFKKVFAEKAFDKSACILVPETTNIFVCMSGQSPPPNGVPVAGDFCQAIPSAKFFLTPPTMTVSKPDSPTSATTLHSAFWCVRSGTEKEVNMVRSTRKVSINVKTDKAKAKVVELAFPILENCEELSEGDELVVLKESQGEDECADDSAGTGNAKAQAPAKGAGKGKSKDEPASKKRRGSS